jgi:hypothetical protein
MFYTNEYGTEDGYRYHRGMSIDQYSSSSESTMLSVALSVSSSALPKTPGRLLLLLLLLLLSCALAYPT